MCFADERFVFPPTDEEQSSPRTFIYVSRLIRSPLRNLTTREEGVASFARGYKAERFYGSREALERTENNADRGKIRITRMTR